MKSKYFIIPVVVVFVGTLITLTVLNRGNRQDEPNNKVSDSVKLETDGLRRGDASRLFDKTKEFTVNNPDKLPDGWAEGLLTGENEVEVELGYYQIVWVVSGSQSGVKKDEIRLVKQATCGKNGSTNSSSKMSVAVQYLLSSGPACLDK